MAKILAQQQLLLELLIMSGDIAVADDNGGSILGRTLRECTAKGWVEVEKIGPGFRKANITDDGRQAIGTI